VAQSNKRKVGAATAPAVRASSLRPWPSLLLGFLVFWFFAQKTCAKPEAPAAFCFICLLAEERPAEFTPEVFF
jgi:hypothetical protein